MTKLDVEARLCDQMADSILLQCLIDLLPDKAKLMLYDRINHPGTYVMIAQAIAPRPDLVELVQSLVDQKAARILESKNTGAGLWA